LAGLTHAGSTAPKAQHKLSFDRAALRGRPFSLGDVPHVDGYI